MGKSTPQPPPAPNPDNVAQAQTASNVNTAVANSYIQNANQYGPYGSTTFDVTGYHTVDGNQVPTFSQTTTLSPEQQHLLDQQQQLGSSLNDVAIQQTGRIGDLLGSPIQAPSGSLQRNLQMGQAPTTFAPSGNIQKSIGNAGNIATGFGDAGAIQNSIGPQGPIQNSVGQTAGGIQYGFGNTAQGVQGQVAPTAQGVKYDVGPQDWSADRQRVEEAIYSRLNPQLDRDRDRLGNELVNQGFVRGTEAFNNSMDEANRQATDARMQAVLAGGQEQSRLAGLAFRQGDFWNQAQGQQYGQNLQSGQFANQAQLQDFMQQQARGQFNNQAQLQDYAQLLSRGQFGNEAQQQAYNQAMGAGQFANQAQQQNFGQQQTRGQFANEAQQQLYNQMLNSGNFANQAQSQQYDQNLGAGQFAQSGTQMNNAALQAEGNFANQAYAQQLQTDLALRNQPINEISALMSGGQVTLPQFQPYQGGQVGMTPVGDYYMQNAQMANQNYQSQLAANAQQNAGLYGALGSLGGMGLYGLGQKFSDRRVKRDIKRIGEWINGLPIYLFRYVWSPLLHVGFMAQDVEQFRPYAVSTVRGIKVVNYPLAMRE